MSCNAGAAAVEYRKVTPRKETATGPVGTAGGAGAGSWSPTMWPARKEAPVARWRAVGEAPGVDAAA